MDDGSEVDVNALWHAMDSALSSEYAHAGWEEEEGAVVMPLNGGTFHVCVGAKCPYAERCEQHEKHLVCSLSGRVIASAVESAHDASWTGRSCGSADPDMTSGAVPRSR